MKPAQRHQKNKAGWVILAWSLNGLGVLALVIVFILYLKQSSAQASSGPFLDPQGTPYPTTTSVPTSYYLPTITPNPLATQITELTPTPFYLAGGPRPAVIGFSVSGRPIEVYSFGQGEKQRMIVAGIHGGYEWNTIALADQLITYINDHPEVIPSDVTLYILRDLNPDGDARSHDEYGRVNAHGVDLNRNFPTNWAASWNRDGCYSQTPTTGGSGPASEPETRILMNFLNAHKIGALISYHSAALGIFPGGTPRDLASVRLARRIANVTTYAYPPLNTGCVYTGTLADYAVSVGAAAVDMELTNHEDTDFAMNLRVLIALVTF
jgi:predicted deacylase